MADFSHIKQNYINNRQSKSCRDAYKIVLLSRINQDRADLCQAYGSFKAGLSPSRIWQNLLSAGSGNPVIASKFLNIVKAYPYVSLYAGKGLLKLGKIGRKSKLIQVLAIIAFAKIIAPKTTKDQAET